MGDRGREVCGLWTRTARVSRDRGRARDGPGHRKGGAGAMRRQHLRGPPMGSWATPCPWPPPTSCARPAGERGRGWALEGGAA